MGDEDVTCVKNTDSQIGILGEARFSFDGDAHRVVTFLNKTLKYDNYVFGLVQNSDGTYNLRIYKVDDK